jgi:streptogramin lyase
MSFVIARQRDVKPRTLFVASFFIAASCAAADQGVTIESFTVPTPNANAASIAAAGNGDMWFVESAQDKLGKISPAGTITEIPIPADAGLDIPLAIAKGADDRLWFTTEGSTIGAVKTDGTFQKYQLVSPNDSLVSPVVSGSDNRLYSSNSMSTKLGRLRRPASRPNIRFQQLYQRRGLSRPVPMEVSGSQNSKETASGA